MDDIAIIGMSCKFPGADNVDEFWDLMVNGRDAISKVPEGRWDPCPPEYKDTCGGFLKCAVDDFDAEFFETSAEDAEFIDPQQRLLLEMSWTALENAGINPAELKGSSTGVYVGLWRQDYKNLYKRIGTGMNCMHFYASAPSRISNFLGLTGENMATDSGRSSSMMSIYQACKSVASGASPLAICGGINLLVAPFNKTTFEQLLSPDGRCKTFDEKADGYGRGEGCGILILKKHSHAVRDGDRILGLISGYGVSEEKTSLSFGAPSKESQLLAIQRAFESCAIDPLEVDYVEAHGVGTVKGDLIEISAIEEVYGGPRKNPLIIGSVKTNIGYTESASGVAAIIKVILAMNKGIIPPHRNLEKLNPSINLDSIPFVIPTSPKKWEKVNGCPKMAGVSSFGLNGTNVHMLLQEAPLQSSNIRTISGLIRPAHVLNLSAKTEAALKQIIQEYILFLLNNQELNLGNICYTANIGRAHFQNRISVHDFTITGMTQKLQQGKYAQSNKKAGKNKIAFLFPGQDSEYGRMGKELYDTHPVFRDSMNYICGIFEKLIGLSLIPVIFSDKENLLIHESLYSQIAIFCIQYSLLQLWKSFGIKPDLVIGHSLGEFAAAFAAGALSIEEISKLLYVRTNLILSLARGVMLVVKCGHDKFHSLFKDFLESLGKFWVDVAFINSPEEIVISCRKHVITKLEVYCKERGIMSMLSESVHAYHSRDMDMMLPEYYTTANSLNYQSMSCQYISGMSGSLLGDSDVNAQYWLDHCRNTVNFEKAIQSAINENCNIFIEIGPQPVLLELGKQNVSVDNILWLPSIKKTENNWETILDSLSKYYVSGNYVDWKGFDHAYSRQKISLPSYPFQRQKFWFDTKSITDEPNTCKTS